MRPWEAGGGGQGDGNESGREKAAFLVWTAGVMLAMEMTQARQVSGRTDVLLNGPQLGRLWHRGGGRGAGLQSASSYGHWGAGTD